MQEITQGSVQTGALYFLTSHYNKHIKDIFHSQKITDDLYLHKGFT